MAAAGRWGYGKRGLDRCCLGMVPDMYIHYQSPRCKHEIDPVLRAECLCVVYLTMPHTLAARALSQQSPIPMLEFAPTMGSSLLL